MIMIQNDLLNTSEKYDYLSGMMYNMQYIKKYPPLYEVASLYTHLFELGFTSVCELLGKRVFIRLLSVTGDSSLRSE